MSKSMPNYKAKLTIQLEARAEGPGEDEEEYERFLRTWAENDPADFQQQFSGSEIKDLRVDDVERVG